LVACIHDYLEKRKNLMLSKKITLILLAIVVVSAIAFSMLGVLPVQAAAGVAAPGARGQDSPVPLGTPVPSPTPTAQPAKSENPVGSTTTLTTYGPDSFPSGINPLTGLSVANPENLSLPPALVSITNFPISARPQAGLSFSPIVFEMYIGQGDSRFLALFYGDFPQAAVDQNQKASAGLNNSDPSIGPVRSGRLPYEPLRKQYNGFLVMASAYKTVAAQLSSFTNIFASDSGNINSAMLDVTKLAAIAAANKQRLGASALTGLRFTSSIPEGGQKGQMIWLPYSYLNQVIWRYNAAEGTYHRFQDKADGKTFVEATDRLNAKPLAYDNVVVLFARHHVYAETMIDIDLSYTSRMPALAFRDGKMYNIYWTTANGDYEKTTGKLRPIRFINADGSTFAMKPGQTWVEMVPYGTAYNETVDSENYFDLVKKQEAGSGNWAIHFFVPALEERPAALK
jgi:hypothetical protein